MTTHRLSASQFVPHPPDDVFAFFANARSLARLTPASMGFEWLSDDFSMRAGLEIEPPLTPDTIDFVNQPETVDTKPARMPRGLTPLAEGLATCLPPGSGPGELRFGSVVDAVGGARYVASES